MKRKDFIKKTLLASLFSGFIPNRNQAQSKKQEDHFEQVGFNHLPIKNKKTMKTVLHKAATRGHADHGWLKSYHTFSFASYYNPQRTNFGVLRVLNDDTVAAGKGFGRHPHENMEIISIPLDGNLEHKDSMGNVSVIREGDVQVMSAGTGIHHSEYNKSQDDTVKFLQIWVIPRKKGVVPRYDQISIGAVEKKNTFYQVLSPNADDEGVWIHQDAWFHLGKFDQGATDQYTLHKKGNGVYAFVIDGNVTINDQQLNKRDGLGIWDIEELQLTADSDANVLLMEVPMNS